MRQALVPALLLLAALPAGGQSAEDLGAFAKDIAAPDGLSIDVRVGYGEGVGHSGGWCPAEVTLRQERGTPFLGTLTVEEWTVDVTTPRLRVLAATSVDLGERAAKRHLMMFRPGQTVGVRVVLRDGGGRKVFREHVRFADSAAVGEALGFASVHMLGEYVPIYGVLEDTSQEERTHWPVGLARPYKGGDASGAQTVRIPLRFPDERLLWGLDALLVPEPAALPAETAEAVRIFALRGGRLIVASGRRGATLGRSPLASSLPVEPLGQENRRDGLAAIDSSRPVGEVTPVTVGRLRKGARATVGTQADPLVSRWRQGKGQVAFLAFPWDSPGFKDDAVRSRVLTEVMPFSEGADNDFGMGVGLEACAARPLFEAARADTQVYWMIYLLVGFLLVVGPLDYLAWRKHRRAWVTWVVLVVSALTFSALAFVLGRTGGQSSLVAYGGVVLDPLDPSESGPQPFVAEGLVAFGSSRFQSYRLEIPPELATSHAALGTSFNPLSMLQDDGNPYALLGSELQVELGVATPSVFRLSGIVRGECPVSARFLSPDRLEVQARGDVSRKVHLAREGGFFETQLEEGTYVINWPAGEHTPAFEGKNSGPFTQTYVSRWDQKIDSGLLSACLDDADFEDETIGSPRPGSVDARSDLSRGAWLLLAFEPDYDLGITRTGAALDAKCQALYRMILEPPTE